MQRLGFVLLLLSVIGLSCSQEVSGSDAGTDTSVGELMGSETSSADVEADEVFVPKAGPVVFAVLSDTHIWGGPENTVSQRLAQALAELEGLEPRPEFVVITGDLTDSIPGDQGMSPATPLLMLGDLLTGTDLVVHPVAGNHDYYAQNYPQFLLTEARSEADLAMKEVLGIDPYYSLVANGVKFVLLNSMQGELWDLSAGLSGSLGVAQLEWLDAQLEEGMPTLLFQHHPPSLLQEQDAAVSLLDVVGLHHENVMGVFAGHLHLWAKAQQEGVPVFLTADNQMGVSYHHVRIDPEAGKLEILNEEDIDYGELEVSSCDPAAKAPIGDLGQFEGQPQLLLLGEATAEPTGFGTYLEEAVKMMPIVLDIGPPDSSGLALPALLTIGSLEGNGFGSLLPYVARVDDAPCLQVDLLLEDPCFMTQPVNLSLDLAKAFGIPLKAGWNMRVQLVGFQLQGALASNATPQFVDGTMITDADFAITITDLQSIVVQEYCDNMIAGCKPGTGEMPDCPPEPDADFFELIPAKCDVNLLGFGVRMLLGLVTAVPDAKGSVTASFASMVPTVSDQAKAGAIAPNLFALQPTGNCPAP